MSNDDIINTKYPFPLFKKRAPVNKRAAQFLPFAALVGYEEALKEIERTTIEKITLSIDQKEEIRETLNKIKEESRDHPVINIIYFEKDKRKEGGQYLHLKGRLKNIIEEEGSLVIEDKKISFDDIFKIELIPF